MSRRPARAATLVMAGLVASLATWTGAVAPATADEATDAPVTGADHVTLSGGSFALVDVLRNDSDPNGDDLAICRFEVPDGVPINDNDDVVIYSSAGDPDDDEPMRLLLRSTSFAPGHYTLTYYACDHDYLTPGTLTVDVTRTRPVRARKVAPHVVRFVNPDDRAVRLGYSGFTTDHTTGVSGTIRLAPGQAKRVRVPGIRAVFWSAYARRGQAAGDGIVRGLGR